MFSNYEKAQLNDDYDWIAANQNDEVVTSNNLHVHNIDAMANLEENQIHVHAAHHNQSGIK